MQLKQVPHLVVALLRFLGAANTGLTGTVLGAGEDESPPCAMSTAEELPFALAIGLCDWELEAVEEDLRFAAAREFWSA